MCGKKPWSKSLAFSDRESTLQTIALMACFKSLASREETFLNPNVHFSNIVYYGQEQRIVRIELTSTFVNEPDAAILLRLLVFPVLR